MYDNVNLDNVVMQSNKQPKEEKINEQSEVIQGNHQVSAKSTNVNKYSSPKTKFYENIGF